MPNIVDYLKWRGDVSIAYSPFNEVDNLILNMVAMLDLNGIVPSDMNDDESISMKDAANLFFNKTPVDEVYIGAIIPKESADVFQLMASSVRFGNMKLSRYVNNIDEKEQKQFSAITFDVGDESKYIAFRGTDDTLVGWKENLNMSFLSCIPAQAEALDYLNSVACSSSAPLRIGGHSKGGNLAVFAAMHADEAIQNRILGIYNNDGPGFKKETFNAQGYKNIRNKLRTIVPESSVVGILLEHDDNYEVVKSTAAGLMQHDGLSWQVIGNSFIYLDGLSQSSVFLDKTLKAWVDDLSEEDRREFAENLYEILSFDGAKTLTDLSASKLKSAVGMLDTIHNLDKDSKEMLKRTIYMLIKEALEVGKATPLNTPLKKVISRKK